MTKKEKELEIENLLNQFHDVENYDLSFRLVAITIALGLCKEYLIEYKTPFRYSFMRNSIRFGKELIKIMEDMTLDTANKYNLKIEK